MRWPSSLLMYSRLRSLRLGAIVVVHFENHLVLIVGLLDQVDVVLRIGVVQQREDAGLRDAIQLGLVAQQFDLQVGRVVRTGRSSRTGSPGYWCIFRISLSGDGIDLLRIDAGERVGELSLRVRGGAGADLQHRVGLQERHDAGNAPR